MDATFYLKIMDETVNQFRIKIAILVHIRGKILDQNCTLLYSLYNIIRNIEPKKEEETMLPPRKKAKLRKTKKQKENLATSRRFSEEINACRCLLKLTEAYVKFKNSNESVVVTKTASTTDENGNVVKLR